MERTGPHAQTNNPLSLTARVRGWTRDKRFDRVLASLVVLIALTFVVGMTRTAATSWNDISRVAAIQARVEQGTWALDNSPWRDATNDKVDLNDHSFSGKMPLLSGVGALVYYGLYHFAGLSLSQDCTTAANGCAYYWLSLTLVGIPFALLLGVFFLWARARNLSRPLALLGVLVLGLGTQLFPYALVLNHHLPAAAFLFVGFYALTVLAPRDPRWLLVTGFAAAFATMCDPLAGAFGVGLFLLSAYRYRLNAAYFILGALPPLVATVWLDLEITGTILPPYVIPNAYIDRNAGDQLGFAGAGTPDDIPQYAFKMFLGAQGLFAYNPILLFALAGLLITVFTARSPLRVDAITVALSTLAMVLYVVFRTGNLGGNGYGERYLMTTLPAVVAFIYYAPPFLNVRGRALFGILFIGALALSIISSFQGAKNAWVYFQPPAQLTRDAQTGTIGAKWNLR